MWPDSRRKAVASPHSPLSESTLPISEGNSSWAPTPPSAAWAADSLGSLTGTQTGNPSPPGLHAQTPTRCLPGRGTQDRLPWKFTF